MAKNGKKVKSDKAQTRAKERQKRKLVRRAVADDKRIKILVDTNPRREGTDPHDHFALYKNGMTVGDLLGEKVGGRWPHLRADIERGYVELV